MAFLAYRFLPAALIVGPDLPACGCASSRRPAGAPALLMGAFLTAGYAFQTLGLEETTASNAGFITGLFVVFTPLMGGARAARADRAAWPGPRPGCPRSGSTCCRADGGDFELRGDGLVLLCALAFSAHILVTARAVAEPPRGCPAVRAARDVRGRLSRDRRGGGSARGPGGSLTVWSALLVTSLIASALGFFVQTYAQQHAPPARTALILASEPAFAGLFGYLLADERLTADRLAGRAADPRGDTSRSRWCPGPARPARCRRAEVGYSGRAGRGLRGDPAGLGRRSAPTTTEALRREWHPESRRCRSAPRWRAGPTAAHDECMGWFAQRDPRRTGSSSR